MKFTLTIFTAIFLAAAQPGFAQGFVNLNFEDATIAPTPVGGTTFPADPAECFPGWAVGGSGTVVGYNGVSIGAPAIDLMGSNFPNAAGFIPLQGSYSVFLQYFGIAGEPPTLSQTGLVPADAQSISFLVPAGLNGDYPSYTAITLDGVNVPLVPVDGGRVAGDISAFAGSVAQLTFSTVNSSVSLYFDDIQFSSSTVPEPGEVALAALGIFLLGFHRLRNFPR